MYVNEENGYMISKFISNARNCDLKSDLTAIRDAWPQARFCILALDSSAARELPLTSDLAAVTSWIGSLQQEITQRSQGSSLDRMLPLLVKVLTRAKEKNPEDARLVYILSDGEATDDGQGAAESSAAGATWAKVGQLDAFKVVIRFCQSFIKLLI